MRKLSYAAAEGWRPYSHRPLFSVESPNGRERVLAGMPGGDPAPFARLVERLEPPYQLLYVLHTPRGEGKSGRYQSGELSAEQFEAFVARFGSYLAADARFDLWAYSATDQATVVWDRHDQLFAYGPIEKYVSALRAMGFGEGDVSVSFAHQHHYRQEFDADAAALLAHLPWTRSALREEDEQ